MLYIVYSFTTAYIIEYIMLLIYKLTVAQISNSRYTFTTVANDNAHSV